MQLEQLIRKLVRQEIESVLDDKNYASRGWVKALTLHQEPRADSATSMLFAQIDRAEKRIETLEKQARKLFAVNNNNTDHIKHLKTMFESIQCIAVEGPEVEPSYILFRKIAKEAGKGYDLCMELIKER